MAKAKPAIANSAGAPALPPTDALKSIFQSSFGLVSQKDTLARTTAVIDTLSKALGAAGNCYDVLVTENGHDDEPVIGCITNDIINETLKFKEFALFRPIEPTKVNQ